MVTYCKCAYQDPDGTMVPGEPREIHPPSSIFIALTDEQVPDPNL